VRRDARAIGVAHDPVAFRTKAIRYICDADHKITCSGKGFEK